MTDHPKLKVADEVWIATALLHRENPKRADFTSSEIMERIRRESATTSLRPDLQLHVSQHCVANRPPNPGRYRMLFATGKSRRRLFRTGDLYDPNRAGSKTAPEREKIPSRYRPLLDWYWSTYRKSAPTGRADRDPILALRGFGRKIWDERADDYVRRVREGWE